MDTELDTLTHRYEQMNEADAFVAGRIANGLLGGLVHEPDMLSDFLTRRKSIHRSLHALATKAAIAPIDLSSGLAPPASPGQRAFLALGACITAGTNRRHHPGRQRDRHDSNR